MMKTPSDKQIYFVKQIADALNIDFPQSSKDFTAYTYWKFIQDNISQFNTECMCNMDLDMAYEMCENDVWGEYY